MLIKEIKDSNFTIKKAGGINHWCLDINEKTFSNTIIASMFLLEHDSGLEVLKLAAWCHKNNIKLVMYGMLNQLPLFSIFADSVILQDYSISLDNLYKKCTICQIHAEAMRFFSPISLSYTLPPPGTQQHTNWCPLVKNATEAISDEEVVELFAKPTICMRSAAFEKYNKLINNGDIVQNSIMCEVKPVFGGKHVLSIFKTATEGYEIPICFDEDAKFRQYMLNECGQDYLSVQILCAFFSNWMWTCYGGAASLFSFLPVKCLSLSNGYLLPDLIRKFAMARFGELGKIFPELETLIYCFPSEKDGLMRTDEHPPLPDLRKLTKEFSELKWTCQVI